MKAAVAFVAVSVLGAVGINEWRAKQPPAAGAAANLRNDLNPASLYIEPAGSGDDAVSAPGQVQPQTRVCISSALSLPVVALPLREGDRVSKGSILARLDDTDLQAALRAAEARRAAAAAEIDVAKARIAAQESQVASSRVGLGEAERNRGRIDQLTDQNLISQAIADEARCRHARLKADCEAAVRGCEAGQASMLVLHQNLKVADAELERARVALAGATIASPIDGIVTRLNVKVGEVVTGTINNPGTILMEIADMDRMVLVARVDEASIARVKVGQKVAVHLQAYPGEVFPGAVQAVALASTDAKDGGRYFKTEVRLETGGRLVQAGLSGNARIECSKDAHCARPTPPSQQLTVGTDLRADRVGR